MGLAQRRQHHRPVAERRHQLRLSLDDRACLLYDAFTGFEAATSAVRRQAFFETHNVHTLQGDGKWSVHGSPADGCHAYFRKLNDVAEDAAFGFALDPWKRQSLEEVLGDLSGLAARECNKLDDILQVGLYTVRRMPKSLIRWAWTSRGYFSAQEPSGLCGVPESQALAEPAGDLGGYQELGVLRCLLPA